MTLVQDDPEIAKGSTVPVNQRMLPFSAQVFEGMGKASPLFSKMSTVLTHIDPQAIGLSLSDMFIPDSTWSLRLKKSSVGSTFGARRVVMNRIS